MKKNRARPLPRIPAPAALVRPAHRKRFGQHFLRDARVIDRILQAFAPQPSDIVCEIGPGEGVLTRALLGKVARLHAVELDRDLVALLQRTLPPDQITLHSADALTVDFRTLVAPGEKLRLIGNLPYNISTPILFHLLDQVEVVQEAASGASLHRGPRFSPISEAATAPTEKAGRTSEASRASVSARGPRLAPIADMLFMLQKEVVDRLAAAPGGKDYGRLSVMIQWRCRVEKLFDVAPQAFAPPPQVDSSVVRLVPHAQPPIVVPDPARFSELVRAAFVQRRKTLRNNLRGLIEPGPMLAAGIDPQRRAETLTLEEFARLASLEAGG